MVSDQRLVQAGQSLTGGEKPHRPMLKVEFTSATDLSRLIIENSWNLGAYAYFCG